MNRIDSTPFPVKVREIDFFHLGDIYKWGVKFSTQVLKKDVDILTWNE